MFRRTLKGSVGFVPTMGALHKGHLSLVEKSNQCCDCTVVSIFINPQQFAEHEDLDVYPKNIERDIDLLSKFTVDVVFIPPSQIMYPKNYSTYINEADISLGLEGESRPTFFRGVATIVSKLFNIVQPSHSFFGEKDAQQLRVISKMVEDLNYPINIVPCPIVREENGLAMSSRNEYLSNESRQKASILFVALSNALLLLEKGERSVDTIKKYINETLLTEKNLTIDYISVANYNTLESIDNEIEDDVLISIAVFYQDIRLIDNVYFSI